MKYNRLYAAFIFAFLAGCSGDGQYKEALLPQIDVNEEYPEKEIFLQDVRGEKRSVSICGRPEKE